MSQNQEDLKPQRTLLKLILNSVLTKFGWIIVSYLDEEDNLLGYGLKTYPEHCRGPFWVWFKVRKGF